MKTREPRRARGEKAPVRSVCPFDCPDACGLIVEVSHGKAVSVTGDPDHPFTRGTLCPKMLHYERTVHSPARLTTPLLRSGPKGAGLFTPTSWEKAIALVAARWKEIIAEHGAQAILPYSYAGTMGAVQRNCGHAFFYRMGASRLDRTICAPAKGEGWKAVMGGTPAPHPDSAMESDLVILWGVNAAATNIHFMRAVREARKRGAAVWLIDTYRTPTADFADRVILVKPGSDGALALGMMHVLTARGITDRAFLADHVQGFEELAARILPAYAPHDAARITGLPAGEIVELAAAYGAARAPFIRLGGGLTRYGNGAMTVRCIASLPALVGAYGKRGAGLFADTSTSGAFSQGMVTREDFMTSPTRIINMNRLGSALTELEGPRVMSLYVYHSNPAAVAPDQNAVLKGLSREDLFTVVHERFMTDTAGYADVVLPATSSLEHPDLYRSYGSYHIQRARAAIPPVGQSRSNWDTFSLLAKAMGFTEPFFFQSTEDLIERILDVPTPLRNGVDEAALRAGLPVELPLPPQGPPFATPSGKVEIYNPRDPEPFPRYIPTHEDEGKLPLRLMTAVNRYALNSSFYEQEDLRRRQVRMTLQMSPADAGARGLSDGEKVAAYNERGEVVFFLSVTDRVPDGVVAAEGIWWLAYAPGPRSVNALTSQRLTDRGEGSTFYDTKVEVRRA